MKNFSTAFLSLSAIVLFSAGCLKEKIKDNTGLISQGNTTTNTLAVNLSTDKAAYNPGDVVTITIDQDVPATTHVRYKQAGQKGTKFVHTLNGTAVSCARALVAILENYQNADGSVTVPPALVPWVGKDRIAR